MHEPAFAPGFRCSALDVGVLVADAAGASAVAWLHPWIGFAIGFVALHFFLFCNVLHIARPLELARVGVFAAGATMAA
jgi:hypothetical protein